MVLTGDAEHDLGADHTSDLSVRVTATEAVQEPVGEDKGGSASAHEGLKAADTVHDEPDREAEGCLRKRVDVLDTSSGLDRSDISIPAGCSTYRPKDTSRVKYK